MEILNSAVNLIGQAIPLLFSWQTILSIGLGTIAGILVGAMPGLTATMAVALLIPITFSLSPIVGLALMGGVYSGAMYGGSISAILLATPGTPAAATTAFEGYPLSKQGKAGIALKVSVVASFCGGIFSTLVLLLVAPLLAAFALKFGPAEYFILAIMGLASIVTLTSDNLLKGLISGIFGLIIATIGTDPISGEWHYTFGFYNLVEGVSFMPALIGLFSITQMLTLTEKTRIAKQDIDIKSIKREKMPKKLGRFISIGSVAGTIIGILPGAGATIAGFVSYNLAKQHSKKKELFGKGSVEGIAASESGNNGCVGGSLVPLLTLGIPGNTVAAALMGGLIINGLIPGPELFTINGGITYAFILSLFIANIVFLIVGTFLAPYFSRISFVPTSILIPIICTFSIIGSYAINNSIFDIWLMFIFALIGYILQKLDFSMGAIVLGMILGPIANTNFGQALAISGGNYLIFLQSPVAIVLWIFTVLILLPSILKKKH